MNFRPRSNQFMPTSCQLRVVQYARTISHDSPAPHSYHPAMGRRQRRQPINPPRCSRLHGTAISVWNLCYIESLRKRKLSIGGYNSHNFDNKRSLSKTTTFGLNRVIHVGRTVHAGARRNGGPLPPTCHPTNAKAPEKTKKTA